jgi:hypothetical protein
MTARHDTTSEIKPKRRNPIKTPAMARNLTRTPAASTYIPGPRKSLGSFCFSSPA